MEKDMIIVRINNEDELRIARFITGFKYATRQFPMYIVLNNNLKNDNITYSDAEIYKSTYKEKAIGIVELIHIAESKDIFESGYDKYYTRYDIRYMSKIKDYCHYNLITRPLGCIMTIDEDYHHYGKPFVDFEYKNNKSKTWLYGRIEVPPHLFVDIVKGIKPSKFKSEFDKIQKEVHRTAIDKGWWNDNRSDAECIALMHSELSECLEALRRGDSVDEHCKGFMNSEVELADCIIRIMDFAEKKRYRLSDAIIEKMKANKRREKKHGKRF